MRWEPRLGNFVDLVEFDDVANGGSALFKTVEAFRGTFFFSTNVELKTKSPGGGGAGQALRKIIYAVPILNDTTLCQSFDPL